MPEERKRSIAYVTERKGRFERELLRARLSTNGQFDPNTLDLAQQVLADFDRLCTKAATVGEPSGAAAADVEQAALELARMRAYILPIVEVRQESSDLVTTMEDWGVPRDVLERWRYDLERLPGLPDADARAMLRTIIWDTDYWSENIESLFELRRTFVFLIAPLAAASAVASLSLLLNGKALAGFLLGAVAGVGASLLRRPPALAVYRRIADIWPRTATRCLTGIAAAFLALGLLQAGLITVPLPRGGDLVSVYSACAPACSPAQALVIFAAAFALGYSEQILPSLGESLVGPFKGDGRRRTRPGGAKRADSEGTTS